MVDLAVLQRAAWAREVPPPVGMAMHVHSSFSEGTASMLAQMHQANLNDVDVLWWTDHDWRMSGHGYRQVVHFSGLTESESGHGKLTWKISRSGSLASSAAAISSARYSVADPVGTTSLRLAATSTGAALATIRVTADAAGGRQNLRGSLAGQSIVVDVFPESGGPNAYFEIRVELSDQPPTGGRGAGTYAIAYRIGGPDAPGTQRVVGRDGYIGLSAPSGQWSTVTLTPGNDLATLWPDLVAGDTSMRDLSFAAGSQMQAPSASFVDYLRFQRATGDQPLLDQQQIMGTLALRYPAITQLQGVEVSLYEQHINWFGSGFSLPDYGNLPVNPSGGGAAASTELAGRIHQVGGLSSLNHPFGSGGGALGTQAKQDSTRRALATKLIANRAYGVDIIEAGYASRSGIGVAGHLALWDALSRNAIFLTGTGVNDSHGGPWKSQKNTFLTWAWSPDAAEASLVAALAAGRIWFAETSWRGMLDLLVDGATPMGSASVSTLTSRSLTIMATGVPSGGTVRLIRGPVDLAGPNTPDPGTTVTSYPGSQFAGGSLTVSVATATAVYVRVEVVDANGRLKASSNPVWLLKSAPPGGIPAARAVA
jgi:hypothetical protein